MESATLSEVGVSNALGPVRGAERLYFLDVVRGFALLGILLMNVLTFGLPEQAYVNPHHGGGTDPLNVGTLVGIYLIGEGKMRALFSMMFGAGSLLLINRGIAKGGGIEVADLYYRRTFWLMAFGIIHGYLIWWGDILYPYAVMGLLLFLFRKFSTRALIVTASLMLVLLTAAMTADAFDTQKTLKKYQAIQDLDLESTELTKEQKEEYEDGKKVYERMYPDQEKIQEHIDNYRGSYAKNIKERAKAVWRFHKMPIYFPFLWDMLSMMLLGMALLKTGVLSGERSYSFYWKMAAIGFVAGMAINGTTMFLQLRHNFDPVRGLFDMTTYEIGRVPMALSYIAILALIVKAGRARWITSRLCDVGRMAFSNYISHSIILSIIFYGGYGFGMIGKLERWQLYSVVLAIWCFNLTWSPIWLRHFQFGPLEWAWRSLTYWKRQPMRIRPPAPPEIEQTPTAATLQ
jgi:uncharacterized protein